MNPGHVYWNAHVDKANIASYDYSALLYLNTHNERETGRDGDREGYRENTREGGRRSEDGVLDTLGTTFGGGEFAFVDGDADRVVQPRAGRLVAFTSGLENLHRVEKVTRGTRYVLAMWFTCSESHAAKADVEEMVEEGGGGSVAADVGGGGNEEEKEETEDQKGGGGESSYLSMLGSLFYR
jgi:hypothetical protein